jgi:hypothetical protein
LHHGSGGAAPAAFWAEHSAMVAGLATGPLWRVITMSPWLIAVLPFEQHTGQYMIHAVLTLSKLVIKPLILSLQYLLYNHNMWSYIDSPFSISYKFAYSMVL